MLQAVGTLLIGSFISLFFSWKMTLVCLISAPIICGSLILESTLASKANNKARYYIEQSAKVSFSVNFLSFLIFMLFFKKINICGCGWWL